MKTLTVHTATETEVAPAGNRDFIHIQNLSNVDVRCRYDGDESVALDATHGFVIQANGGVLQLDNVGVRNIYTQRVVVWQNSGGDITLNLQGVS